MKIQHNMFTIDQVKAAHSKVKSGADFPAYIAELKALGVVLYETYVTDGHTDYKGGNGHKASSPAKYDVLMIAETADADRFKKELKEHQQGMSDYPTFCNQSANNGVEKWEVDIPAMTCTYFDKAGNTLLVETIPSV